MRKILYLCMLFTFSIEATSMVRLPGDQREILRKWGKAPREARKFLDDLFSDREARKVFVDIMNKVPSGVSQEFRDSSNPDFDSSETYHELSYSLIHKYSRSMRKAQEIIRDFDLVDLSENNFVLTSNTTTHPLYNHVVIMLKYYWPSPYQLVGRVYQNDKIATLVSSRGLNRVRVAGHWLYRLPGRPNDIIDYNYVVVMEKIKPLAKSLAENKQMFEDLQEKADKGDDDAKELLAQTLAVIENVGVWAVNPIQTVLVEEDGVLKVVFLDTEWPGFAQYSGLRHIYNANFSKVRPGDVNSGKQGLQRLTTP